MNWEWKLVYSFVSLDTKWLLSFWQLYRDERKTATDFNIMGEPHIDISLQGRDKWTLHSQGMHELEVTGDRWCCKSILYSLSLFLFSEVYGSAEELQHEWWSELIFIWIEHQGPALSHIHSTQSSCVMDAKWTHGRGAWSRSGPERRRVENILDEKRKRERKWVEGNREEKGREQRRKENRT